jgi:hypothetical protein
MLSALSMCKIGAIVLVDGQTKATFEGPDVVLEEVGVFVEVDGFEGEFSQTLSSVGIRR